MKFYFIIFLAIFLVVGSLFAQSKIGTTAAAFLQIGVGGRSVAMGETAGGSALDASSIYLNPALAASLTSSQVYFFHNAWFAGINLEYGAALLNLGRWGNVGASFYIMNSGQIEVTTEERPEGTGEKYTVQDFMIGLTYTRSLTDRFNIGGTLKLIRSAIWNMSASTMAVDLGLSYQTPLRPITIAMSISNFGGEMQMSGTDLSIRFDPDPRVNGNNDGVVGFQATRSWDLPVSFRFGASYRLIDSRSNKLLINSDVLYPNNNYNYVNLGLEYCLFNMYYVRAGYRQLFLKDREGGLSIGGALRLRNVQLDYAFSDWEHLNFVQSLGIGLNF